MHACAVECPELTCRVLFPARRAQQRVGNRGAGGDRSASEGGERACVAGYEPERDVRRGGEKREGRCGDAEGVEESGVGYGLPAFVVWGWTVTELTESMGVAVDVRHCKLEVEGVGAVVSAVQELAASGRRVTADVRRNGIGGRRYA